MAANQIMAVRYDHAALKSLERQARGIPHGMQRLVPPALNRTARWTRTRMKRELAKQCRIKVRRADQLLRTEKAGAGKWNARVELLNRRIGIGKFARGRRRGPVAATFPSGLGGSYPHHFRARIGAHRGVFVRGRFVKPGLSIRRPWRQGPSGRYRTELPIYEQRERLGTIMRLNWLPLLQQAGLAQLQREIASRLQYLTRRRR